MSSIQIFDSALGYGSGPSGADGDHQLVEFAVDFSWAKQSGVDIERFNLDQQPVMFAENEVVKAFLARAGTKALPLTLVGGEFALAGRYPHRNELMRWSEMPLAQPGAAGGCLSGRH